MINIAGASEGRIAPVLAEIIKDKKGQSLVVVPSYSRAGRLQTDLSFFSDHKVPVYVLPPEEDSLLQYEVKSDDSLLERVRILKAITTGEDCVVIAPVTAAIRKLPPKETFISGMFTLTRGQEVDISEIKNRLSLMGYERISAIEGRGEYSIRGGIIDLFTPEADYPFRIELFDTEVDSIRTFDPDTQRSVENLKSVTICQYSRIPREREIFEKAAGKIERAYDRQIKKLEKKAKEQSGGQVVSPMPVRTEQIYNLQQRRNQLVEFAEGMINLQYMEKFLGYFYDETMYLWDYMESPRIVIDDPARILETLEAQQKERAEDLEVIFAEGKGIGDDFSYLSGTDDYFRLYELKKERGWEGYIFTPFVSTIKNAPFLSELRQINCRQMPAYNGRMDSLKADLEGYLVRGYDVTIVASSSDRINNIREFLARDSFDSRATGTVTVKEGVITGGVELTDEKKCFIWEGDIFGSSRRPKGRRKRDNTGHQKIRSFADIQEGDFVVHESHGIGRFTGIEQLIVQGVKRDYLQVKYAGTDMLYIPVDQLGMLQKYIGGDGASPSLNRLAGSEWKTAKAKAKAAVVDMAEDLIKISAERMHSSGYAFGEDTVWQKEFEDSFPYTETDDQARCIEEIKEDMERNVPMDRLLLGDVGFGKTEVAARALFKCVAEGKQAAVLVPTTLLANQHYYTLKDRFEKFPFKVEMLSRFRSPARQKEIIRALGKGEIDLVIGTHRLLSQDVKFRDLGLLVVDEEQRFGVRHKERVKQLRANVDVLTLSATPIPRTLHMSLSGIRDMSTIEEPPEDRYPVQTYVMEQDEFVIREAIEKEMARGGQVYILYNRVESINRIASDIRRLVPDAEVAVGHGKMRESELEDIIMDFAEGRYDVLVSTTIIESGMDIPNVNTMIVFDADRFGLAQLYQLRGRVGRSGRMAYAYLMYKRDKNLTEIAEKRLRAIRDFTEFGSGFKIAMKDLELRGAGNLLGTEQSGHMLNVGYELYCKLLDDAVKKLQGDEDLGVDGEPMPAADETVFSLPVTAVIPDSYIDDEALKLQMYKKIAMIDGPEAEADVMDELIDRFGDIPRDTMNLVRIAKIRTMAGHMGVREISQQGLKVKLSLWENIRIAEGVVPRLAAEYGGKIKFNGGSNPYIRLTVSEDPSSPKYEKTVLKELESFFETAEGKADRRES